MVCKASNRIEQLSDAAAIACLEDVHAMKQRGVNIIATNNSWGGADFNPAYMMRSQADGRRNTVYYYGRRHGTRRG
jgi:hypothetical protein